MSELTALQERLAGLIENQSPSARRQMAADIAKRLHRRQQQRIKRQQAPDGTPYTARKRQPVRSKKGRIRREMFAKLRTNRFMKAKGSESTAVVEFTGKVQRMALVHQYGLKDRPNKHSSDVLYKSCPLVGFSREDELLIEEIIVIHLNR
ncbi:phage virion morphogenesis protein [Enterobacteriaceae bacterium RIT691]|nr:phage virion morphogenesis protein [Enterobacteriaceae bacterium RIT691]